MAQMMTHTMSSRDMRNVREISSFKVAGKLSEVDSRRAPLLDSKHGDRPAVPSIPWSAMMCLALSAIMVLVMGWVCLTTEIAVPYTGNQITPDLAWHARSALLLIMQAVVLEVCILVSSYTAVGIASSDLKPQPNAQDVPKFSEGSDRGAGLASTGDLAEHNFGDSALTIMEYVLKLLTAWHFLYPEAIIAHKSALAPTDRAVLLARHAQWAVAVPILVLLANRAFLAGHVSQVRVLLRSAPGMLLAAVYCSASWVMEATLSLVCRNILMILVLVAFVAVCVDQVVVALSVRNLTAKGLKFAMLGYQFVSFTVYAVIYFVAYFGFIGCAWEQSLYTYMDASVKVLQGCFLAMIRNFEDIRIIKHWWQESVAARRDFERLVKTAKVPIFTLDLRGRVDGWNAAIAQITNIAAEVAEGQPITSLLRKECKDTMNQAIAGAAGTPSFSNPLEIMFKKGGEDEEVPHQASEDPSVSASRHKAAMTTNPVVLVVSIVKKASKDGVIQGFAGIGQDITEISELKAVEQKKVQLMAVVSHELRSPLHGMIGLTNMMEQGTANGTFKRQLNMVRCCATRLLDLVTNIMDMTEAEQRRRKGLGAEMTKSLVNFAAIAEEVTVMTMMATDKAGKPLVSSEVQLLNNMNKLKSMPVVLGNPYKCTQLLYNLVTNACKFTKKGSVAISAKHKKEASTLEIYVEDTGAGISEEALERIFQPFEQDHGSTADARSFQGMGLGLAVCKECVRLHNGTIVVSSKLGVGSTFTISLPCEDHYVDLSSKDAQQEDCLSKVMATELKGKKTEDENKPEDEKKTEEEKEAKKPEAANANNERLTPIIEEEEGPRHRPLVLSVDDDVINQEVVQTSLGEECDIVKAMNGNEALQYLETQTKEHKPMPDVVLLDIQMPGLTGNDVLAEIRRKYGLNHSKLPVIMVSAKAPSDIVALRSYNDGCFDFLIKPFHTGILRAKVNVALQIKTEVKDHQKAHAILTETARVARELFEDATSRVQGDVKVTEQRLQSAQQLRQDAEMKALEAAENARAARERASQLEQELVALRAEFDQSRAAAAQAAAAQQTVAAQASVVLSPPHTAEASVASGSIEVPSRQGLLPLNSPPHYHGGNPGDSRLVRYLYDQLADREHEVARLHGRLAEVSSSKDLASKQLDVLIQAATHSKALLEMSGSCS